MMIFTIFQYSWCESQTKKGTATLALKAAQQWCVCSFKQSHHEHVKACGALRRIWVCSMLRFFHCWRHSRYPNLKTIRQLVYKRGFAKINKQRIPLTDNSIIEEHLGKHGIICMEDLVHEIYTAGPHFTEVTRFLWPFKLSNPKGKSVVLIVAPLICSRWIQGQGASLLWGWWCWRPWGSHQRARKKDGVISDNY